ncbi:MAG: TIGR03960 family B12-binding radical SAM protein [Planctomycetes bacterium]|nr:TIGR03960 family B12-binding radical SAM protein [Planctomycetota bacterium]
MFNQALKDYVVGRILPGVQTPARYMGGEHNIVRKDYREVRGRLCLAFPDIYSIGMSHHGIQLLYSLMNARDDWACERVFTPWFDMENRLRETGTPLYSLENFTPLNQFDVIGFSLQYELSGTNVLTMLDLGNVPLRSAQRTLDDPLVIAGGPCAQNPEPLAPFIDVFVAGDGEPSLPAVCDLWRDLRDSARGSGSRSAGVAGRMRREEVLAELAKRLPFAYVPRFYEPEFADGRFVELRRTRSDVPESITPSVVADLESIPIPTRPIVPFIECVHDRIAVEIMRGCPWQCRFCQSSVIKRPLRARSVETIVRGALESYRNTGFNEISILSLSTSDYPDFAELVTRLRDVLGPLGVNVSIPSLRVNDQLRGIAELIGNDRRSSLTLAPEVARDDMREQIRKKIKNEDLLEGCRAAFRNNYESVKLYFLCGLPGERPADLDGIIEMAESIARIGKEERGRFPRVTASVSNFVPKAHTAYQWNAMARRAYFQEAHRRLRAACRLRAVQIKCHDVESSLIEGVLSRGDRRVANAIELAWRRGARLDGWREHADPGRWWKAIADCRIDVDRVLHEPVDVHRRLPWDHLNVRYGRAFLEKEQGRSAAQLRAMAEVGEAGEPQRIGSASSSNAAAPNGSADA